MAPSFSTLLLVLSNFGSSRFKATKKGKTTSRPVGLSPPGNGLVRHEVWPALTYRVDGLVPGFEPRTYTDALSYHFDFGTLARSFARSRGDW